MTSARSALSHLAALGAASMEVPSHQAMASCCSNEAVHWASYSNVDSLRWPEADGLNVNRGEAQDGDISRLHFSGRK